MALPAQINSGEANFRYAALSDEAHTGPWTYEGAVFVLCFDDANDTAEVWWDEAPNRGETFAEADSANHIAVYTGGSQSHREPAACVIESNIYVLHLDSSGDLAVSVFSMATKLWGRTITGGPTKGDVAPTNGLTILPLSGERMRIAYNGAKVSTFDVIYVVDLGLDGMWGTPFTLNDGVGSINCYVTGGLVGAEGRTHFFYDDGASYLLHRSVEAVGTLNDEQQVYAFTGNAEERLVVWDSGVSYVDFAASAVKLAVPYNQYISGTGSNDQHAFKIALADSAANPMWTLETVTADPIRYTGGRVWCKSCTEINGDLYYALAGVDVADVPPAQADRDLYVAVKSDSSWGSASNVYDDATLRVFVPRINQIDIGYGIVFSMLVGGFLKPFYYEAAVDPCPAVVETARYFSTFVRIGRG